MSALRPEALSILINWLRATLNWAEDTILHSGAMFYNGTYVEKVMSKGTWILTYPTPKEMLQKLQNSPAETLSETLNE